MITMTALCVTRESGVVITMTALLYLTRESGVVITMTALLYLTRVVW